MRPALMAHHQEKITEIGKARFNDRWSYSAGLRRYFARRTESSVFSNCLIEVIVVSSGCLEGGSRRFDSL